MRVLVIPDVHLKSEMFQKAAEILRKGLAERAVCLMDLVDDWGKEYMIQEYEETLDAAIDFAREFPDTLWCYGNHDLFYMWNRRESGFSHYALYTVQRKLLDLRLSLPDENPIRYIQRIDNVIFAHGGVLDDFVRMHVSEVDYDDVDKVIERLNQLGPNEMWAPDFSPIWLRPQGAYQNLYEELYQANQFLHVVGHTPVKEIKKEGNLISCDVFSTRPDGTLIGTREFLLLDTETWEYETIKTEVETWIEHI